MVHEGVASWSFAGGPAQARWWVLGDFDVGSFGGPSHADETRMTTIRKHEQLIVWQLGQQISQRVAEILSRAAARTDRNYCSELQEAADAISANIAEGFDRYRLPQFR